MTRPRFRLWVLTVVVAVAALAMYEVTLWDRVRKDYRYRVFIHRWERSDGAGGTHETYCPAPFWPQYWRRALALPWPGTYRCDCPEVGRGTIEVGEGGETSWYRYAGSRAASRDEAGGWWAATRSLITLNLETSEPVNESIE